MDSFVADGSTDVIVRWDSCMYVATACVQVACHCYQQYYDTMKPVGDRDIAQQTTKNV